MLDLFEQCNIVLNVFEQCHTENRIEEPEIHLIQLSDITDKEL